MTTTTKSFVEKINKIYEKWEKHPLLEGCDDKWIRRVLAAIFDNRNLHKVEYADREQFLLKVSYRIFNHYFIAHKLVSVQPSMDEGTGRIYYIKFDKDDITKEEVESGTANLIITSEEQSALSRSLKSSCCTEFTNEMVEIVAEDIQNELTREILNDLRYNAATFETTTIDKLDNCNKLHHEEVYQKVVEVSNVIYDKILRGRANWIVTSPFMAKFLDHSTRCCGCSGDVDYENSKHIMYFGTIFNKFRLFVDPLYPKYEVLLGYKGDSYLDSGYVHCPYLLTESPVCNDPDMCYCRRYGMKYSKRLINPKYYARILFRTEENKDG